MAYIDVPIVTEPIDLSDDAYAYISSRIPGWLPSDGNLESILTQALSQQASELRVLCTLVPDTIFAYFGGSILGLPRTAATPAFGQTTWTMLDTAGYEVPAGTLVAVTPPASSTSYAFEVQTDFAVAPGATVASGVAIVALEPGAGASGLTGTVQVLDPLDFVLTVTLDTPTSGGQDAETMDAYLTRLSNLLTLLAPRPILPQDFAVMAQRMPEVARAVAIDLYNAQTGQVNVPRCVTVAIVDENGNPLPTQVKTDLDAQLQAQREVNFQVFVIDPTYTTIDVTAQIASYPGYDPAEVASRAASDVAGYLLPSRWGLPPYGDTSAHSWLNDTIVRYTELIERINRTEGVHYVVSLTFRKVGGTMATTDVTLTGVAPLPRPGTITVTGVHD